MTHEDKIIEELEIEIRMAMIAAKSNPTAPKAEHYSNLLNKFRTTLTTYRTQVLEEVEKPFLNIASEYSKPWSKEDEVAVKCTQVFLKHVESLKHHTN